MSKTRAVAAALLAGLLAGAFLGAWCERAGRRRMRSGPDIERSVRRFERALKLDAAQTGKVREVLESRRGRHQALRRQHMESFRALRADIDSDIEKLLNDEQKKVFAEKRARWRKKAHAR